jgi:hypothetical protein
MRALTLASVAAALAASASAQSNVTITVDTLGGGRRLGDPFLNFNVDTGSIYNGFQWLDPVLINLVYALNPLNSAGGVVVRVGGTAADYSLYVPDSTNPDGGNGVTVISEAILEQMWSFGGQAHAQILFDFNGLFRNQSNCGPWDPTVNATAILDYLNSTHPGATKWAWSLGNEPEFWKSE